MEPGDSDISANVYLVCMMKLAVATAILKGKPKQLTGQEYARKLCNQFVISELNWRRKYENIEIELIHAKQELVLKDIHLSGQAESQSDSPSLLNSEPIYPTPPPSFEAEKSGESIISCGPSAKDLSLHTKFLQGVSHLKWITRQSRDVKQLTSITKTTIVKSVNSIEESISQLDTYSLSSKCLLHATETIATVCTQLSDKCWIEIKDCIETLLMTIIKGILLQDQPQENASQEQLCEMFLNLGCIERLHERSLDILLTEIENFSTHLRDVATKKSHLDPVIFENMYFILKLTEALVTRFKITKTSLEGVLYNRFTERLEDSLLHLTDQFPLYAELVWKISCLFLGKCHFIHFREPAE